MEGGKDGGMKRRGRKEGREGERREGRNCQR